MKTSCIIPSILALSTISSAWQPTIPEFGAMANSARSLDLLAVRQDNSGGNGGSGQDGGQSGGGNGGGNNNDPPPPSDAPKTDPPDSNSPAPTPAPSDSPKSDSKGDGKKSDTDSKAADSTPSPTKLAPINPAQDPPATINMLTPASTAQSTFYKVGATVTFKWDYSALLRQPAAVDVLATFSPTASGAPPPPFTISSNMSFEATQTLKWDTGDYAKTSDLPVGTYTLIIYDADAPRGMSATPQPGHLAPYQDTQFGMYTGQTGAAYTELTNSNSICATCNAAVSLREAVAVKFILGTTVMTVSSFVWFAGGWGVLL